MHFFWDDEVDLIRSNVIFLFCFHLYYKTANFPVVELKEYLEYVKCVNPSITFMTLFGVQVLIHFWDK